MKCQVCGAESGKYPLCRECNKKRETGEIIKCSKCRKWHDADMPCKEEAETADFLYELKDSMVTKTEMEYLKAIKAVLPEQCLVQVQANLASFIKRTDNARFQSELFRNVDFIIMDSEYHPLAVIEVNDKTHLTEERRARDKKVANICEEAGIPVIVLWTSYGVNPDYIKKRITEAISTLPIERIHHFVKETEMEKAVQAEEIMPPVAAEKPKTPASEIKEQTGQKNGCYIATCIYGSYDCPQVWTLRRFRDEILRKYRVGCMFIKLYYAVSPALVEKFGESWGFRRTGKIFLDKWISYLQKKGIQDTPYQDNE